MAYLSHLTHRLANPYIFDISAQNILFLRPEQEKDKTHFVDKDVSKCSFLKYTIILYVLDTG